MVFPLGMYTVCTAHLSEFIPLPLVMELPRSFIYAALAVWALTLAGLVRWLLRALGAGLNST